MRRAQVRWVQVWAPAAAGCCCHSMSLPGQGPGPAAGPDSPRACNQPRTVTLCTRNFRDDSQKFSITSSADKFRVFGSILYLRRTGPLAKESYCLS